MTLFGTALVRVFVNGPGYRGSIPGKVIPKTQKWYLLNTQHYKVHINGKWSDPGKEAASPVSPGEVALKKGAIGSPSTTDGQLTY